MRLNECDQVAPVLHVLVGNLDLAAKVAPGHVSSSAVSEIESRATGSSNVVRNEPKLDLFTVGKCNNPCLKTTGDRR